MNISHYGTKNEGKVDITKRLLCLNCVKFSTKSDDKCTKEMKNFPKSADNGNFGVLELYPKHTKASLIINLKMFPEKSQKCKKKQEVLKSPKQVAMRPKSGPKMTKTAK